MEEVQGMTNEQYFESRKTLLLLVIELIKNSSDKDEAIKKIEALIPDNSGKPLDK